MRIIARKTLCEYCLKHPEIKSHIDAWYMETKHAAWNSGVDILKDFPKTRLVGKSRIIFDILHNRYRLVVKVNYMSKIVYIRFIGTHKEYDKIKVEEV